MMIEKVYEMADDFEARYFGIERDGKKSGAWPSAIEVRSIFSESAVPMRYYPADLGIKSDNPGVEEIVEVWLKLNGFDGLFSPGDCSCRLGDLAPCGDFQGGCVAGYFMRCGSDYCDMQVDGKGCIGYDGCTCEMEG